MGKDQMKSMVIENAHRRRWETEQKALPHGPSLSHTSIYFQASWFVFLSSEATTKGIGTS